MMRISIILGCLMGVVVIAEGAVPPASAATERKEVKAIAREIDRRVEAGYAEHTITPNPLTTDEQFARRVYLDIVGRIPTHRELTDFLAEKGSDKRFDLIDQLLESEGYVSHMYNYWADVLRIKTRLINQVPGGPYIDWVKRAIRENLPYDQFVYELLTAEGRVIDNGASGYLIRDSGMPLDNMANTIRIFLGTRIGCAQCHDHPFDKWTQFEFYEMAAFTSGTQTRKRPDGIGNPRQLLNRKDLTDRERRLLRTLYQTQSFAVHDNSRKIKLPDDYKYKDAKPGQVVQPRTILGEEISPGKNQTPRMAFAAWLTSTENPQFAPVIANRLWARTMGVGLVHPVDDFNDDTQPSNPELLDYLSQQIRGLAFDTRSLNRAIFYSKTYQRQVTVEDVDPTLAYHFPGPLLRRMTAEQLWDSVLTLIVPDLDAQMGTQQYVNLSEQGLDLYKISLDEAVAKVKEITAEGGPEGMMRRRMKEMSRSDRDGFPALMVRASEWVLPAQPGSFLEQFGASDKELIDSAHTDPNVSQALEMLNGQVANSLLDPRSVVAREVAAVQNVKDRIRVLFLSILGREPTRADLKLAMQEVEGKREAGLRNLAVALLNTREFMFVQ